MLRRSFKSFQEERYEATTNKGSGGACERRRGGGEQLWETEGRGLQVERSESEPSGTRAARHPLLPYFVNPASG